MQRERKRLVVLEAFKRAKNCLIVHFISVAVSYIQTMRMVPVAGGRGPRCFHFCYFAGAHRTPDGCERAKVTIPNLPSKKHREWLENPSGVHIMTVCASISPSSKHPFAISSAPGFTIATPLFASERLLLITILSITFSAFSLSRYFESVLRRIEYSLNVFHQPILVFL
jgi:hypothetical protein